MRCLYFCEFNYSTGAFKGKLWNNTNYIIHCQFEFVLLRYWVYISGTQIRVLAYLVFLKDVRYEHFSCNKISHYMQYH